MTNHLGGFQRGDEQRWQVDGASHEKGELLMPMALAMASAQISPCMRNGR